MDDDAPLSALVTSKPPAAKPGAAKLARADSKKPGADDNTPLSSLANRPKPAAPKKAGTPLKGGTPGKRKRESSSSSSSSSYSSSSSGSRKGSKRKREPKGKVLKKKTTEGEIDENRVKKKERGIKEQVVADVLSRWWYVLPDWPPRDPAYYKDQLDKRGLRKVRIEEWEWVPEVDQDNRKKVYELSQFRGVFRDQDGSFIDVRPQESCPCQSNMMKKDLPDLYQLLVKAYEAQLEDLAKSVYDETLMMTSLKSALNKAREKAFKAGELGSVAKKK